MYRQQVIKYRQDTDVWAGYRGVATCCHRRVSAFIPHGPWLARKSRNLFLDACLFCFFRNPAQPGLIRSLLRAATTLPFKVVWKCRTGDPFSRLVIGSRVSVTQILMVPSLEELRKI